MNVADASNRSCRVCGCTEVDCLQCIARTGGPCHWVAEDLCSACVPLANAVALGIAKQVAEQLGAPGVVVLLLDPQGHLHLDFAAVDAPIAEPLLDLARGIDSAIRELPGMKGVQVGGNPIPPPIANCSHCREPVARLGQDDLIREHMETCKASPVARELQRLRDVEARSRTIVEHWRSQDGFNAALLDELAEVVGA